MPRKRRAEDCRMERDRGAEQRSTDAVFTMQSA
jgi:hypothetical protein